MRFKSHSNGKQRDKEIVNLEKGMLPGLILEREQS